MSGTLTADQAIDLLRKNSSAYSTPSQLRVLATQVNADSLGRLTVLYSGGVGKGVWSSDVIDAMVSSGEDVRVIDKSEAAKFLKSEAFNRAVAKSFGIMAGPLIEGTYRGPATDWLYHSTQGPWADASARFAELTKGEVRAVVSGAAPDRVFGALELPRVIANPQVTTIEGIPRQTLAKVVAEKGLQPAFEMMVAKSHENVGTLRAAVNAAGMPIKGDAGTLQLDSRAYLHGTPAQAKTPISTAVARSMGDLMGPPNPAASAGQAHLQAWQAQIARDSGVEVLHPSTTRPRSNLVRGAGALGIATLAYDGYATARDTTHLVGQGNLTGAQSEILHFGARNVGMFGGAALGASAGGALGGVPGAVIGGAAGVVAGGVAGDKLMEAADQARIYHQRGSDGNHWQFDPHQPQQGWTRLPRPGEFGPQGPPEGAGYKNDLMHAAPPLADELNYKASSSAVELALARPPAPQDPYSHTPEAIGEQARPGIGAGRPWTRDPKSHVWSRSVTESATPMTHGMSVQRTVTANPEQSRQLEAAAQRVMAENIAHSPQGIAQKYRTAYDQHGWKQHGPVPDAVTHALQGPVREERDTPHQRMPAQPQPASGHPTPQQIERITTHESRIVPTPGGMSFAEAHRRRDKPEQISPGSLQPVGKLDVSHAAKGSLLSRMHQAQEQDLMRGLGIALAQDRERFGNEPSPQRTVERAQERTPRHLLEEAPVQKHFVSSAPEVQAPAPIRGAQVVAPVAQDHVSPARPAAAAEAMHSPTAHASVAAPVHSNPQGAAAAIAAAQAEAAAARAESADMRAQMVRMAEQRRQDDLERRDERDQREAQQLAQGRDSRQHLDAAAHGKPLSETARADTSRPLLRDFSDPGHPQNALYTTLKEGLPARTAPELLSHLTAACYKSGIKQPGDLGPVVGRDGRIFFSPNSVFAQGVVVDVTQPAPSVQQTMQEVQQFDQQRADNLARYQAQTAAQTHQQQGASI